MKKKLAAIITAFMLFFGVATVTAPTANAGTFGPTCSINGDAVRYLGDYIYFGSTQWGYMQMWHDNVTHKNCWTVVTTVPSLLAVNHFMGIYVTENKSSSHPGPDYWMSGNTKIYVALYQNYVPPGATCYTYKGRIDDLAGHTATFTNSLCIQE